MADPKITVIIVGLNAANDLPLTIESVIGQDYPFLEVIVRDGASWDSSGAVLRRYEDHITRIVTGEDAGVYHAMNDALRYATGDYVIFMNTGDRFHRADSVGRMVAAVGSGPDIFYGDHVYVDRSMERLTRAAPFERVAALLESGSIDEKWHSSIPGHQATFTRLETLRRLRFDTRFIIGADHDLLFRAWQAGAKMDYVDEIVAHYAAGGMSATMFDRCRIENASIYRRFSRDPAAVDKYFYPEGSPFSLPGDRKGEIAVGRLLSFTHTPDELGKLLGGGWSEPEQDHVWSIGPASELRVRTARGARALRLSVAGNPHVERGVQHLMVMVNETPVREQDLYADRTTVVEIGCKGEPWLDEQPNRILLSLNETASCVGDTRDMGLLLSRVDLV